MQSVIKNPNKISHTVWPNGHVCYWSLVNFNDMFVTDKYGNVRFAWTRMHKDHKAEQSTLSNKNQTTKTT